ncbi:MAG: hypothetical protein VKK63_10950 [Synechococcus sp.]|nr:hypothetical protein [Synechococcus sp.]
MPSWSHHLSPLALLMLLAAAVSGSAPALAQQTPASKKAPTSSEQQLQKRRIQLQGYTRQQQQKLEQRLQCIDKASTTAELERCQRFIPAGAQGWGMGCPMW